MTSDGKERIGLFDAMKGVCIVFMVVGHSGAPFARFLYLFHMAVFLMLAGLFHRGAFSDTVGGLLGFLRRKAKALWVPYALWMSVFTVLHNVFVRLHFYSNDPLFLETVGNARPISAIGCFEMIRGVVDSCIFRGHEQLGGAFWFLAALFQISVVYGSTGWLLRRVGLGRRERTVQTVVSCILLVLGFLASLKRVHWLGLEIACSGHCLYHLGVLSAPWRDRLAHCRPAVSLALAGAAFPLLCALSRAGKISLVSNQYANPAFLLVSSVLGFLFVYGICGFVRAFPLADRCLGIVGRHTRDILVFHFLAFKSVSAAGVAVLSEPPCLIAAFPVLFRGACWWLAYAAAGVLLPLAAGVSFSFAGLAFRRKFRLRHGAFAVRN